MPRSAPPGPLRQPRSCCPPIRRPPPVLSGSGSEGGSPHRQDVPPGKAPGEWGPGLRGRGRPGGPGTQTPAPPARPRSSPASLSSSRSWRSATASKRNSSFFRLSTTGEGRGAAPGGPGSTCGLTWEPRGEERGLQRGRRAAPPTPGARGLPGGGAGEVGGDSPCWDNLSLGRGWGRTGSRRWAKGGR